MMTLKPLQYFYNLEPEQMMFVGASLIAHWV